MILETPHQTLLHESQRARAESRALRERSQQAIARLQKLRLARQRGTPGCSLPI